MRTSPREIVALQKFARWLGWRGLTTQRQIERKTTEHVNRGWRMIWFETPGMPDFGLQINIAPRWNAAVYAMRYRICSGWHRFVVTYDDDDAFRQEANRLDVWLHKRWFTTPSRR